MKNKTKSGKYIKRNISYYLTCSVISFSIPTLVNANETDEKSSPLISTEAEFSADFLIGDAKK